MTAAIIRKFHLARQRLHGLLCAMQPCARMAAMSLLVIAAPMGNTALAQEGPAAVRIATVTFANNGPARLTGASALVADELEKELRRQGSRLEWVPVPTTSVGATVNEAFAARRIDLALYGDLPAIILNAPGIRTRLVMPTGGGANAYLVVPSASTVKSLADLKGKRIALHRGRPWEFPFLRLAQSHGLSIQDFKILNVNPQVGASALATGSADAFFTLSDAHYLVDKGVGKIIWSTKQSPRDWKQAGGIWASQEFIDRHPAVVQTVVSAYLKAYHWISQDANRERYIREFASVSQPERIVRLDLEGDQTPWKERWSPLFDQFQYFHYRTAIDQSRKSGLIRDDIDVNKLFEPRFVEAALKDYKLQKYWSTR